MAERHEIPGGKNVEMAVSGSVLYLYCDLSKDSGSSTSGKSVLISSSSGNKPLGNSGAFIGLNIFTKSLDKRDLSKKGLGDLGSGDYVNMGEGCQWRVEKDGKTLCIKIDFDAAKPRAAASGKSTLLATSSGNKPIGATGLSCGLNCYYPSTGTFNAAQLVDAPATQAKLAVGEATTLEGGFTVKRAAANKLTIAFTYRTEEMADGHVATMPTFQLGETKIAAYVAAVKAARARTEKSSKKESPPPSEGEGRAHGDLQQEPGKESKVRNVTVTCTADGGEAAEEASAYTLELAFDPTQSFGRSSSGSSMMVASTGGFQRVLDAAGKVVCRVSLNAYRPAQPVTSTEVAEAVQRVLSAKPKAELMTLPFKGVLAEVLKAMGASESMKDSLKATVKEEVTSFLKAASQA